MVSGPRWDIGWELRIPPGRELILEDSVLRKVSSVNQQDALRA